MELFPSIISRAKTLQVVHSEVPGHASGSIHLVKTIYNSCYFFSSHISFSSKHIYTLIQNCYAHFSISLYVIIDFTVAHFYYYIYNFPLN